jgi:Bacterial Ig domain
MRLIGKIILIILILGILLGASAYIILYTEENPTNNNHNNETDTEPPQIDDITGSLTVTAGQTVTITALFSDNINVTEATLYYKEAGATSWDQISILDGTATITIPSTATSNYYYYVTVDDAAGNGPVGDPSTNGSTYYTIIVQPGGGNHTDENFTHTVFIEDATASWCTNCPNVANILRSLYDSKKYSFYYVSLVNGTSSKVTDRLYSDYNIFGFPTVFIDGGYRVILGGSSPEPTFIEAITAAQQRLTVPQIKITLTAQYQNTSHQLTITTLLQNKEDDPYTGRLKLYLTEIVSHWTGYDSKPYHFGFLAYVPIQEAITIPENGDITLTGTMNISAYDYENLMIIGVVFSKEKQQGYASPPDENPFDAYYADATNATKIVAKGNLPPQLQITSPEKGKIYLNGDQILGNLQKKKLLGFLINNSLHNKTLLLGKITITVDASDDSAIAKVEFYLDDELLYSDTQAPYAYTLVQQSTLKPLFFKKHTLAVTAYDNSGKSISANILFLARL